MPQLSIVVPAYNEETKLYASLRIIVEYFRAQEESFEVIVVNDGSSDRTLQIAEGASKEMQEIRIIDYKENRGKGYAVKKGVLDSSGEIVLFMDADLSTRPEEWPKFREALNNGLDIAIGSRRANGSKIAKPQPILRETMGKVFTYLSNKILFSGQRISDISCGFKAFKREVAHELFAAQKLTDWSFDAEILYIAKKHNYSIVEVPITWTDDPNTKVKPIRAAAVAFIGLLKIRINSNNK